MSQTRTKKPINRRVRRQWQSGDLIGSKVKSFTIPEGVEYHPVIDLKDFSSHCDCPDHFFRHNFCKHLRKTALNLIRRGELAPAFLAKHCGESCCRCKATEKAEPLFSMCHDDGSHMEGVVICYPCIEQLRAEQRGATNAPTAQEIAADDEIEPFECDDSEELMTVCGCGEIRFSGDEPCGCAREELSEEEESAPNREFCRCGRIYPFQFGKAFCLHCGATTGAMHALSAGEWAARQPEDLEMDAEDALCPLPASPPKPPSAPPAPTPPREARTVKPLTEPQLIALQSLGAKAFSRASRDADLLGMARNMKFEVASLRDLSSGQASRMIDRLKKMTEVPSRVRR